jgi:hypothetical protein
MKRPAQEAEMTWKRCVLVVANQTADSEELLQTLLARSERGATEFGPSGSPGRPSSTSSRRRGDII